MLSIHPASPNEQLAYRVSIVSIIINILLVCAKLFAGIVAHSTALVSDAVHSLSDVVGTIFVIVGVKMSNKKADSTHPYGHEKMECLASIVLAIILIITGLKIGIDALTLIVHTVQGTALVVPTALALFAALLSIVVKEWMYWYTLSAAKKINSSALKAEAWHHRSDALSSVGSLVGIGGAMLGFPICDPLVSILICLVILKVAYDILSDAINKLVDRSLSAETNEEIRQLILDVPGVTGVDMLKSRMFGAKFYIDVEISVCKDLSLEESHRISEDVHHRIEEHFADAKHCMVHVNPGLCSEDRDDHQ